jgi:hypothetical protein
MTAMASATMATISFIGKAPRERRPVVDQAPLSPESGCSG